MGRRWKPPTEAEIREAERESRLYGSLSRRPAVLRNDGLKHVLDRRRRRRLAKQARQKKHCTPEELKALPYQEYLQTSHWIEMRKKAFRHHGRKCNRCGKTRRLHIHHKTYENLGQERLEDLEVLCRTCHDAEHGRT